MLGAALGELAGIGDFEANVLTLGEESADEVTETLVGHFENGYLLI